MSRDAELGPAAGIGGLNTGYGAASCASRVEDLLPLECGFLRHYFRLQEAERRLSGRVRSRSGIGAARQIELERQRLGRELHTGVGQMLAAMQLQLDFIDIQLPNAPPPVGQALDRISKLAHDALGQVRSISRRLHPPEWQLLSLEAAIRQLWDLSGLPQRFAASLSIEPLPREPGLESKVLIYRAAQEAFSNIAHHSRATRAEARLEMRGTYLAFVVRDNGAGFDAHAQSLAPARIDSGLGLRSIREQAIRVGGALRVESGPGGTALTVLAPFAPTA